MPVLGLSASTLPKDVTESEYYEQWVPYVAHRIRNACMFGVTVCAYQYDDGSEEMYKGTAHEVDMMRGAVDAMRKAWVTSRA